MATSDTVTPNSELVSAELRTILETGAQFVDPCGDWPHTLFLQNGERITTVPFDELPADVRGNPRLLAKKVIPRLGRRVGAQVAALALPSWFVDPDDDPNSVDYALRGGRPSAHPMRRECLCLLVADSARVQAWMAEVKRRPGRPPKLGEWRGPGETGGLFVEGLRRAVSGQR
jgi:hypothetical protein